MITGRALDAVEPMSPLGGADLLQFSGEAMATIALSDPIAPGRPLPSAPEEALAALDTVRERTLALVSHLSDETLSRVLSPIMSPLVWDLAHIAAYEDLWLAHRHGGLRLSKPELAELYDAFETPRSIRGEVELLVPEQARSYLREVRARTAEALTLVGVGDGTIYELVLRHELQHTETMRQTMALVGLLPAGEPKLGPLGDEDAWVEVPAGPFEMGAGPDGFAYDNERPRHTVELPAFQIGRRPVTNSSWAARSGASPTAGHPGAPVCHVSWFEAEEFARASGARLPSEAEWEKAASLGLLAGVGEVWEWTSSSFDGYEGFVAHPYREYSEVFFGEGYRVLRGGSWATNPRVKTTTFRNWDLPIRSQIFSGLRLARDVS
jgi:gamma-glutamyl hercynylcysteine S-oxide synthase